MDSPPNSAIADVLERVAHLLEAQHAETFRVRAYRHAADVVRSLKVDVAHVAETGGRSALQQIPGIGPRIASAIDEIAHSGRLGTLDRLLGEVSPEDLFTLLPGIGSELAKRIHRELHIDTLEDLEVAAHDGRLARLSGFGERRVLGARQALASVLSRSARQAARRVGPAPRAGLAETAGAPVSEPTVELLLAIDAEYRKRASANELPKIAPRRMNPERKAWLPILHADRDGWSFTALYSNTARAHELGRTHDWVVIYFERDGDEGQRTIVSEHSGRLAGRRVVRGREPECQALGAEPAHGPDSGSSRTRALAERRDRRGHSKK